jgi:hypothetical protein
MHPPSTSLDGAALYLCTEGLRKWATQTAAGGWAASFVTPRVTLGFLKTPVCWGEWVQTTRAEQTQQTQTADLKAVGSTHLHEYGSMPAVIVPKFNDHGRRTVSWLIIPPWMSEARS